MFLQIGQEVLNAEHFLYLKLFKEEVDVGNWWVYLSINLKDDPDHTLPYKLLLKSHKLLKNEKEADCYIFDFLEVIQESMKAKTKYITDYEINRIIEFNKKPLLDRIALNLISMSGGIK